MDIKDLNALRSEFEQMQKQAVCDDGSCEIDAPEDYPDYLKAIYSEVMPPIKSGIYFSRWDLKRMAEGLGESFALDVRERMFQKFMQWVATPEDFRAVIEQFSANIDAKCDVYREYSKAKAYFEKVYREFFTQEGLESKD